MILGNFVIEQLSEGFFELFKDGSFIKMDPSRLNEPETDPFLGRYSSALGIDPLLVQTPEMNIIIDPGLGWGLDHSSSHKNTSNVKTNLDVFGLQPEDIDVIILSHLHYDHAAGATYVADSLKTTPTFSKAKYILHSDEWEFALSKINSNNREAGADYRLDELYRLAADKRFEFLYGEQENVTNGVTIIKSGGHTHGHLVVKLQSNSETAYYLGDLIPTEYHLNHYPMKLMDADPIVAKKMKTLLLREALKEEAHLFFYHSLFRKSGKLAKDEDRRYVILET